MSNVTANLEVDLTKLVQTITDEDRVELVRTICVTVERDGTMDRIREVVNNPGFND